MAVYLPPMTRKKPVPDRYNPDSFRVISTEAENHSPVIQQPFPDPLRKEKPAQYLYTKETEVLPKSMPDYRANRPHPEVNDFLRHNVLLLNEPICNVHTLATHSEQDQWWPSRTSDQPLDTPAYTINTTFRQDFRKRKNVTPAATRHSSNPNTIPSQGAVPVSFLRGPDGKQSFWKEGLSYEHQYNCRLDPSYPIRAKRHGAFVWDKMKLKDAEQFVDYYSKLDQQDNNELDSVQYFGTERAVTWPPKTSTRVEDKGGNTADKTTETPTQAVTFTTNNAESILSRSESVKTVAIQDDNSNLPPVDD